MYVCRDGWSDCVWIGRTSGVYDGLTVVLCSVDDTDGRTDVWVDGWMDGCTEMCGWMAEEWMEE